MSISSCRNCTGSGWLPKDRSVKPQCIVENLPQNIPRCWERCWCDYGLIDSGWPAYWKDRDKVEQVFFNPFEDLERAVLNFLMNAGTDPEQLKILKFYIAQWVDKDPYPPSNWLERLSKVNSRLSLKQYVAWLKEQLIIPL